MAAASKRCDTAAVRVRPTAARTWWRAAPLLACLLAAVPLQLHASEVVVDGRHRGRDGALVGGRPTFRTIGAALEAAPAGEERYQITIRNGRYYEKLSIERPNVTLIGESRAGVVLTYDVAAGMPSPDGEPWGTRGSFTLRIAAPGFRLERMSVENGFDYPANRLKADTDSTKVRDAQAVALLLDAGSDRASFRDCTISGHQDTLFADAGRSYFTGCTISGSVDFIFGAGQAVFEQCDIVARDRGSSTNNGYITAPSTPLAQPFGLLFVRSRLLRESPAMAASSVALGRPWQPGRDAQAVGSAVFIDCFMDDHIGATGWIAMSSGYSPEAARLFEYGSTGPGARPSASRRTLTAEQALYHSVSQALRGWDPAVER